MRRQPGGSPSAATTVSILSPEHLAVCKAMFDRRKDWLDIEQMLIASDDLDLPKSNNGSSEWWASTTARCNG